MYNLWKDLTAYFEKSNTTIFAIEGNEHSVCLLCQKKYDSESEIKGMLIEKYAESVEQRDIKAIKDKTFADFILSTTPNIEGKSIESYLGIVGSQTMEGINIFKDIFSGVRNIVGGRSTALQEAMKKMRVTALNEIKEEAFNLGANAVVGIKIDFDEYSEGMIMLSVSGTAGKVK